MLQKINSAEILPSGFSCQVYKNNQSGSVAIIVALAMIVLLTITAFVIDTGYLYGAKNKYQNGVEAAAMAGAVSLCDDDPEGVARQVAIDNGLPAGSLVVQAGFYDEKDLYEDFSEYKDFVAEGEGGYPEDQFNNAVMVKLNATEETLMGGFVGKDEVNIGASAVAYLKRYSMVSLADDGEIRLGNNSRWKNGDIYANGDIKYPERTTDPGGNAYQIPEFTDSAMFAAGEILECPVGYTGMLGRTYNVYWENGQTSSLFNAFSGQPEVDDIRPMDDAYINELKTSADVVYTANDSFDDIFFGCFHFQGNNIRGDHYHFDLAGNDSLSHITYFFDAGDDADAKVILYNNPGDTIHTPNGYTISNVTFIANCPIHIYHKFEADPIRLQLGGTENQQVQIISSSDISIHKRGGSIFWKGVFLRCGGNFLEDTNASSPGDSNDEFDYMRIIADGEIKTTDSRPHKPGFQLQCDFMFGPPCPPTIPRLGRLELSASD